MDPSLTQFAPHGIALLSGGLLASLLPAQLARRDRGRAWLAGIARGHWRLSVLLLVLVPVGTAVVLVRSVVMRAAPTFEAVPVGALFVLGLSLGLPMAIPALATTRRDAVRRREALERWKEKPATIEDRRAFAEDLARMIEELGPTAHQVTAEVTGKDGRVLALEGDLPRKSGEMLTHALREEMTAVGIERVEGAHRGSNWWTRV